MVFNSGTEGNGSAKKEAAGVEQPLLFQRGAAWQQLVIIDANQVARTDVIAGDGRDMLANLTIGLIIFGRKVREFGPLVKHRP
ncbi:Uncharacterised protein [Serratia odorifera]|uniref:Uncharacterized protein n=1 Tax=Serratia odorifera TaxID=618 RepID=A0A3S4FJ28_SEROD|nr:Uncharacterised protein [Serratia odorifera]